MSCPDTSDDELGLDSFPRQIKRVVHNKVERRRKDKINGWIVRIGELLPDRDPKKQSKNGILERAVELIIHLKESNTKLMLGNCVQFQVDEFKRLETEIKSLTDLNHCYLKLLRKAGITPTADFVEELWKETSNCNRYPKNLSSEEASALKLQLEKKASQKSKKKATNSTLGVLSPPNTSQSPEERSPEPATKDKNLTEAVEESPSKPSPEHVYSKTQTVLTQALPTEPLMSTSQNGSSKNVELEANKSNLTHLLSSQPLIVINEQGNMLTFQNKPLMIGNSGSSTQAPSASLPQVVINPNCPVSNSLMMHQGAKILGPLGNGGPIIIRPQDHNGDFHHPASLVHAGTGLENQVGANGSIMTLNQPGQIHLINQQGQSFTSPSPLTLNQSGGNLNQQVINNPNSMLQLLNQPGQSVPNMPLMGQTMTLNQQGQVITLGPGTLLATPGNSNGMVQTPWPSALLLPNGQIIPVVSQPSVMYAPNMSNGGLYVGNTSSTLQVSSCSTNTSVSVATSSSSAGQVFEKTVNLQSSKKAPTSQPSPPKGIKKRKSSTNEKTVKTKPDKLAKSKLSLPKSSLLSKPPTIGSLLYTGAATTKEINSEKDKGKDNAGESPTDILAKATESIFSSNMADISSMTAENFQPFEGNSFSEKAPTPQSKTKKLPAKTAVKHNCNKPKRLIETEPACKKSKAAENSNKDHNPSENIQSTNRPIPNVTSESGNSKKTDNLESNSFVNEAVLETSPSKEPQATMPTSSTNHEETDLPALILNPIASTPNCNSNLQFMSLSDHYGEYLPNAPRQNYGEGIMENLSNPSFHNQNYLVTNGFNQSNVRANHSSLQHPQSNMNQLNSNVAQNLNHHSSTQNKSNTQLNSSIPNQTNDGILTNNPSSTNISSSINQISPKPVNPKNQVNQINQVSQGKSNPNHQNPKTAYLPAHNVTQMNMSNKVNPNQDNQLSKGDPNASEASTKGNQKLHNNKINNNLVVQNSSTNVSSQANQMNSNVSQFNRICHNQEQITQMNQNPSNPCQVSVNPSTAVLNVNQHVSTNLNTINVSHFSSSPNHNPPTVSHSLATPVNHSLLNNTPNINLQ